MLGQEYKDLYENYYASERNLKRELTAEETLGHIQSLIGNQKVGSIVDIGAGEGSLLRLLHGENRAERYVALEISSSGVEKIKGMALPNVTAIPFDGYTCEFRDKEFDLALSIHVMEHVEHERLYLSELKRISKRAIIEVPLELNAKIDHSIEIMKPFGHINFYTKETFCNLLKTCGLSIKSVEVNTLTLDMDRFLDGKFKGTVKNYIRKGALSLSEKHALRHFVYLCSVFVDCD